MKRLIFGLKLSYELEIEFSECWDCSRENKHHNFILIFCINKKKWWGFELWLSPDIYCVMFL